jgi:hypothetical protein
MPMRLSNHVIDRGRGDEVLGGPTLARGKIVEALREPDGVRAKALPVVAVPLHGLEQLSMAEASALETIAEGAAELLVGIAAEAELGSGPSE